MTTDDGSDFGRRKSSLDRQVSWRDVWAGVVLTLVVATSAIFAAALLWDGPPAAPKADRQGEDPTRLLGVQDPSRPGWRATNGPFDPGGMHETVPDDAEDRAAAASGERR
jgi:hypothetical protein